MTERKEWKKELKEEWKNEWTDEWMKERMKERMEERKNERKKSPKKNELTIKIAYKKVWRISKMCLAYLQGNRSLQLRIINLDHHHLLDIIHVNKQNLMMQSQENEFGDKNNLDRSKMGPIFFLGAITTSSC